MFTFLVVIHVIACTVLVVTVLLQQGKGAEVGAVFGSSEAIFGSAGPATLLSKVTTVAAIVFMLTSLSLTYLSIHSRGESVMQKVQQTPVVPAQLPKMPATPVTKGSEGLNTKPATGVVTPSRKAVSPSAQSPAKPQAETAKQAESAVGKTPAAQHK